MRATMRITWQLLSLSFLFLSICSNVDSQSTTTVTKNTAAVTTRPSAALTSGDAAAATTSGGTVAAGGQTGDQVNDTKTITTQAPTTSAAMVTTPTMTATSKPTDKPSSAGPQMPTATNSSLTSPIITSGNNTATPAAPSATPAAPSAAPAATPTAAATVTSSPPKTVTPAATADSSGSSAVTSNATTMQTPEASIPDKTSGTGGTTKITKVPTGVPTPMQQSANHTTIATKTSQDSKGAEKTTVPVRVHEQTSRATGAAGNMVITSTPSTLINTGSPAQQTIGTKAGNMSSQTPTATTRILTTSSTSSSTTAAQQNTFLYTLNYGTEKEEEKDLVKVCRLLMVNLENGSCTMKWKQHNDKIQFNSVVINGTVKNSLATQYYEDVTKKPTDSKILIAILASSGALLIMIVILAVCASHHRKPYNENQQHLTEELHTVENGYHDNPTLEVMEVQPEMQEKKVALNGEFNDSWIVPIDNLLKEDIADEEDTHL